MRALVLVLAAGLLAGPALAQPSRPPPVVPRHIPTPSPIARPAPKPNYTAQSMRLIQQNILQQQMAKRAPPPKGGSDALLQALMNALPPEPPPLPKLTPTPQGLAMARQLVTAQLAMPSAGDLEQDTRLIALGAALKHEKAGKGAPKPDTEEIREALTAAQGPLWDTFVDDLARQTAEAFTEPELRVQLAFATAPEFPSIIAKQPLLGRALNTRAVALRQARNRAGLDALCAKAGPTSAYCLLAADEGGVPGIPRPPRPAAQ